MSNIKRNSRVPLYKQVKNQLLQEINKNMKEGDLLQPESEMEKQYGVSRITVRKAIDELVAEGVIFKAQGRGTFVRSTKIVQNAGTITSWTEEMHLKGKSPSTQNLMISEVKPSRKMIDKLHLQPNEKLIRIERLRLADGEPIALMFNYLREKYVPGLLNKGLTRESLYEELEENYNIVLIEAQEQIKARLATDLEASALKIPPGEAVLHINRTSFLKSGIPFEMVEMINRADRYEYYIKVSGREKLKSL
ncbi:MULTISPECIES: GntR family transcriptional regulator [Virgibacillus]|jgi:GntR family transcriptional regulator|uniref:GntR family transcriptional regulator n=1 Tax=Virgibacillus TaxID=84406 RepID=UPI00098646ED|nr:MULTISPECIES: GntR family transcriptional regulator [Virgibacillus]